MASGAAGAQIFAAGEVVFGRAVESNQAALDPLLPPLAVPAFAVTSVNVPSTVVVAENRAAIAGDVEVGGAIVIVVADGHTHAEQALPRSCSRTANLFGPFFTTRPGLVLSRHIAQSPRRQPDPA